MNVKDKIRGCFLGCAIGDAIGKPVETLSAEVIAEKFGKIDHYFTNSTHKWFSEDQAGTTTDDYQLTKALARAFIKTGEFDLDAIAEEHRKEFLISVRGWGHTTRDAVARIAEGVHWKEAAICRETEKQNTGTGNGIAMKVSPIGLYMGIMGANIKDWKADYLNKIVDVATMTHPTSIAITSGLAQSLAAFYCFSNTPKSFKKKDFLDVLKMTGETGEEFYSDTLKDNLLDRFKLLDKDYTDKEIIETFGKGTCYVYDSLPFTYAFFLKNPNGIEILYDCASAGGDTDSNASMLGALLGALHGSSIFPEHLTAGLQEYDEVIAIADEFYAKFV